MVLESSHMVLESSYMVLQSSHMILRISQHKNKCIHEQIFCSIVTSSLHKGDYMSSYEDPDITAMTQYCGGHSAL